MTVSRSARVDAMLMALVFAGSAAWGASVFSRTIRNGGRPYFYQSYFEPAVMTACGRGFLVSPPGQRPAALQAFLLQQRDRFSCAELPPDLHVGKEGLYQGPWRYLMTTFGLAWMVLGISWSGLAPLAGVFFGATTTLAYALCRQIAGRVVSLLCAAALCVSPLQTSNLPNLRDYAKAPFTVALALLLIALVVRPWRPRTLLLLSLAYGLVMGIGLGFRGDLLIDIPPFFVAVALFLPGGVLRNIRLKLVAVIVAAVGFIVTAWPIIQATVVSTGGCQAHVFLLGLSSPFNDALGVKGGSYGWGHLYNDEYVWATVSNYATRFRPDLGYIEYCSHEYDTASWEYARHIVAAFPADFVTRAYASVLHVLDLPFARVRVLHYAGVLVAAAFVLVVSWSSIRVACFALFFIAYFGGHPAIQFQPRHYFPFEFITAVAAAFLLERAVDWRLSSAGGGAAWALPRDARVRGAVVAALVAIAAATPLAVLRSYQQRRASALLLSYTAASSTPLLLESAGPGQLRVPNDPHATRPTAVEALAALGRAKARFVEAVITAGACRPGTTVTFRYDPSLPVVDFSRTVELPASTAPGPTRLYEPVYAGFIGLDTSDPSPACQPRIATLDGTDRFPLMLSAQLAPGWESLRQYQQIVFSR